MLVQKEEVGENCFDIKILLGKRDDIRIDFIARTICEICIKENVIPPTKPILFAIGLQKETSIESVRNIIKFTQKFLH